MVTVENVVTAPGDQAQAGKEVGSKGWKQREEGVTGAGHQCNVWDEVGGRGEGGVLPGQPDLVRAIPCQHVQVVHEN